MAVSELTATVTASFASAAKDVLYFNKWWRSTVAISIALAANLNTALNIFEDKTNYNNNK